MVVMKSVRDSNVEALRCLLMFFIVLWHCCFYGETGSWQFDLFVTFLIWHVDVFVGISGWYGIKFTWQKFFRLWGMVLFYSLFDFAFGARFDLRGGWFGATYLALMMIAPILNAAVDYLVETGRRDAFLAWMTMALMMIFAWSPFHLFSAVAPLGAGSHTLLTMTFVYITMRFCRKLDVMPNVLCVGGGVVFFIFVTVFLAWFEIRFRGTPLDRAVWTKWTGYNAPHVLLVAALIVLVTVRYVRVPNWVGRVVNFISPSMFGVYLLHDTTLIGHSCVVRFLQGRTGVGVILVALIIFVACLAVDLCRRGLVAGALGSWRRLHDG